MIIAYELKYELIDKALPKPEIAINDKAIGIDLYSRKDMVIPGNFKQLIDIPLNIKIKYPENSWGLLCARSSLCNKKHLIVANSVGIIDPTFDHEHMLRVLNFSNETTTIKKGEKVAQLIILPKYSVRLWESEVEGNSIHKGFGSTGGYK